MKPGKPYNENILSYDTGFEHGRAYAKIGMSMAYERHEGYGSRFEPYFARGYEAGWKANR